MSSQAITAAAETLARAHQSAQRSDAAQGDATAHLGTVQGRIAALEADRDGIIAARAGGFKDDAEQGPKLVLIAADLQGLAGLRTEAAEVVAAGSRQASEAAAAVGAAQQSLDGVRDAEYLARLVEHAGKLDGLLLAAVQEIGVITQRTGRRTAWAPSADLALILRRLDLGRGGV